jgi:hypothetical protein
VRTLVLPCPSAEDAEVFKMLERVDVLDVTLPNADSGAVEDLAAAIQSLRGLRALTIRKAAGTYLNQPAPRAFLDALADAVTNCPELVSLLFFVCLIIIDSVRSTPRRSPSPSPATPRSLR